MLTEHECALISPFNSCQITMLELLMWVVLFILWVASFHALPALLLGSSGFLLYPSVGFYSILHKTLAVILNPKELLLSVCKHSADSCKGGGTREVIHRNQMVLPGWIYLEVVNIVQEMGLATPAFFEVRIMSLSIYRKMSNFQSCFTWTPFTNYYTNRASNKKPIIIKISMNTEIIDKI